MVKSLEVQGQIPRRYSLSFCFLDREVKCSTLHPVRYIARTQSVYVHGKP